MGKNYIKFTFFATLLLSFIFYSFNFKNSPENKNINTNYFALDAETQNWLDRVDSAGGTVSDSVIVAVDDYIKEVKGIKFQFTSIRNRLLRENWFCGDFKAAFVPVLINGNGSSVYSGNRIDINRNYLASDYTDVGALSGLKGNGVNKYIETGFNPYNISEIGTNDAHFMIYSMSDTVDAGRMGCKKNNDGFYFYPKYLNGNSYISLNSGSEVSVILPSSTNYIIAQRISQQNVNVYYRSNQLAVILNSSTIEPNIDITIGAFNNNGTVQNHSSLRLGGYSLGLSFTAPQELVHYNAVQRLMSRLGREINNGEADFKSKLFTFTGDKLVINYKTRNTGSLQFEIQDENGIPFSDFSIENCIPVTGNSLSQTVTWNSSSNLTSLVNTPVYLRIKMSDADLFSLQFQNKIVNTDSSFSGIKLGTYKQFFADTLLFMNNIPVNRKMHNPVKETLPVIAPVEDWENNSLVTTYSNVDYSMSPISNQMVYKMWLTIRNSLGAFPGYYESTDGVNWMKPNLELFKFNGSTNNNILTDKPYPGGLVTVINDSAYNRTDSTRKYKSVYNTHTTAINSRLNVSFSYDGLIWTPYSGNPVRQNGEDLSSCGWNPVLGKYLGYFRDSLGIRKVGRYISDDWINWTYTGTVLKPDENDIKTTHFYNMTVLFKDSVYWGFAGVMRLNEIGDENPPYPTRTDNTTFIALMFSRDGINFTRCGNTQPFLVYGNLGEWDDQMVYTIGVPVNRGNEYYIYYNGFNVKHYNNGSPPAPFGGGPIKSQIGLAKIGMDRFVSLSNY